MKIRGPYKKFCAIVLVASLSSAPVKYAEAQEIKFVVEYFEGYANALKKAGTKASNAEFGAILRDVEGAVNGGAFFELSMDDPNYVTAAVDNMLSRGYLSEWTTIAGGLDVFLDVSSAVSIPGHIKDAIAGARGLDKALKGMSKMIAGGDVSLVNWLVAVGKAGYYSKEMADGLMGLDEDARTSFESLLERTSRQDFVALVNALKLEIENQLDFSQNELMSTKAGRKVALQALIIAEMKSQHGLTDEYFAGQNLYVAKFRDRWGPFNTYDAVKVKGWTQFEYENELVAIPLEPTVPEVVVVQMPEKPIFASAPNVVTSLPIEIAVPEGPSVKPVASPKDTGRFFGWVSYFGRQTAKHTVTGPGNGSVQTYDNGLDNNGEVVKLSGRAPAQGEFTILQGLPNEEHDETTTFTNVRAIEEVNAKTDRYKPGVFVNTSLVASLGQLPNYDLQNYNYAAWGKWNGDITQTETDTLSQYETRFWQSVGKKGYWAAGEVSSAQAIKDRTGKASYKGSMVGDYLADGSSTVEQGVAIGNLSLDANFDSNTLTGRADVFLARNGSLTHWFQPDTGKVANIVAGIVAPENVFDPRWEEFENDGKDDGGDNGVDDPTKLPADFQQGLRDLGPILAATFEGQDLRNNDDHDSELVGSFFGPNGSEIGGMFNIEKDKGNDPGVVTGVFRAMEQTQ